MKILSRHSMIALCLLTVILFSCKKKSKVEAITFDYTYPDISFSIGDSASFGSTLAGWTYLAKEKIDNRAFLSLLDTKKVLAKDIASTTLKSCVISFTTPTDSTFNTFDSVYVKMGGTFSIGSVVYFSAYPEKSLAQLIPISHNSVKSLSLTPTTENLAEQTSVDENVQFKVKFETNQAASIKLPIYSMKASLTLTLKGNTH